MSFMRSHPCIYPRGYSICVRSCVRACVRACLHLLDGVSMSARVLIYVFARTHWYPRTYSCMSASVRRTRLVSFRIPHLMLLWVRAHLISQRIKGCVVRTGFTVRYLRMRLTDALHDNHDIAYINIYIYL